MLMVLRPRSIRDPSWFLGCLVAWVVWMLQAEWARWSGAQGSGVGDLGAGPDHQRHDLCLAVCESLSVSLSTADPLASCLAASPRRPPAASVMLIGLD